MKNYILFLALISITSFFSCGYGSFSGGGGGGSAAKKREAATMSIYFEDVKFEKIKGMAEAEQKPIFIDFYTDWCAPCRWMDKDAFHNDEAARYFNKNLVNLKVNAEKGEGVELKQLYDIKAYPTVIYLKPDGTELARYVGMTTASNIIQIARKAVQEVDEMYRKEALKK